MYKRQIYEKKGSWVEWDSLPSTRVRDHNTSYNSLVFCINFKIKSFY